MGLTKLEIGANRLATLQPLTMLSALCHLSVENNEIDSLAGIEQLTCLLELYASNNAITDIKDLQRFKALPRYGRTTAKPFGISDLVVLTIARSSAERPGSRSRIMFTRQYTIFSTSMHETSKQFLC